MKGCRPLTDTEIELVLGSFRGKWRARNLCLFTLGIKSGFRISELLSLSVSDVWQFDQVVERVSVQRGHMKRKREGRTVLLHPLAQQAIVALIEELRRKPTFGPKTYLFQSQKGPNRPLSRVGAWLLLKKAFRHNRLTGKTGTHSMRKVFCGRVFERLRDPFKAMQATGHKSMSSLMAYLSYNQDEVDQAIREI
jgi:integrase